MIKQKPSEKVYMNLDKYRELGKKLDEEKKQKAIMRKATKPNNTRGYH